MGVKTPEHTAAMLAELANHGGFGGCNPDEKQLRALIAADRAGPLQFVNLLAYHDEARYPDGHELWVTTDRPTGDPAAGRLLRIES